MLSHTTLIAVVVTKEDSNLLTQGFTKYQPTKDEFKVIRWKYFYPFEKPYTDFSVGDVVMLVGKFVVKNLEQYLIASNISIIAVSGLNREFESDEIPLSVPHCMFLVLVKRDPQPIRDSTFFDVECFQYNSFTNSKRVLMKLRILYSTNVPRFAYIHAKNSIKPGRTFLVSGFVRHINPEAIAIEATDIDFMYAFNAVVNHNVQEIPSMTISIDEIESTISQTPKKNNILATNSHSTTSAPSAYASSSTEATKLQKGKKKLSDLALDCLGLNIVDEQENKSEDDNNMADDEVIDLEEQISDEKAKKRRKKN
ncbi:14966_t:CDS:2, partial [Cetraspora pellucida]